MGEEVELLTLVVEGEEREGFEKGLEDLGDRRRDDKVNEYEVDETMCGAEDSEDGTAELKQPSMVVNKEVRKMVRMKFFGDDVEKMKDCRRKRNREDEVTGFIRT